MKNYHFSPENGEFVGESEADESPLEHGVHLLPAHATQVAPPRHVDGSARHWIAGGWEYRTLPPPPPPPPGPTPEDLADMQARADLDDIDRKSIRALREKARGLPGADVVLADLDGRASEARKKLKKP